MIKADKWNIFIVFSGKEKLQDKTYRENINVLCMYEYEAHVDKRYE